MSEQNDNNSENISANTDGNIHGDINKLNKEELFERVYYELRIIARDLKIIRDECAELRTGLLVDLCLDFRKAFELIGTHWHARIREEHQRNAADGHPANDNHSFEF